jgi:hypothetical protein
LVMNDRTICDVLMDVLGGVNNRRLDSLSLDYRLNGLMDVMMSEVVSVGAAFDSVAFGG